MVGVSKRYVCLMERGEYTPKWEVVAGLCQALGVRVSELVEGA